MRKSAWIEQTGWDLGIINLEEEEEKEGKNPTTYQMTGIYHGWEFA